MLLRWWRQRAQQRRVQEAFGRYLRPAMVQRIAENPTAFSLGGELRELTLLFLEIANFDNLCAELSPMEARQFLNDYYDESVERILENKGLIDKFLVDGVMAFFGAPLDDSEHPDHAAQAAIALVNDLRAFNTRRAARKQQQISIHIGLHTDSVAIGNIGGRKRLSYSVTGLGVLVASRLPPIARERAISVLATEKTVAMLKRAYKLREVAPIQVADEGTSMRAYELLGNA